MWVRSDGGSLYFDEEVGSGDEVAGEDVDFFDFAFARGVDGGFHFHSFDAEELGAFGDGLAEGDVDGGDFAGHGGADVGGVLRVGLGTFDLGDAAFAVGDFDFARLAVEFKEDGDEAVGVGVADGEEFDEEGFARLDFDGDFLIGLKAVEEGGGGDDGDVAVGFAELVEVEEDLGVHEVRGEIGVVDFVFYFFGEVFAGGLEVDGLEGCAGAAFEGFFFSEDDLLEFFGETAGGLADVAAEEFDDGFGEREVA